MRIERLMTQGRFWRTDAHGYLINDADRDLIDPAFAAAAADAVRVCAARIGPDLHSIYLTGSAARGLAVPGLSDLNLCLVTAPGVDSDLVLQDWIPAAEEDLLARHPALYDAQIDLWPYEYVFGEPEYFSIGAFILRTQSVALWGADLTPELPDYAVSAAVANDDIVQIGDDIAEAVKAIAADPSPPSVRYWLREASRHLLWTGFGLVMESEGRYTRDLDLCCACFAQHYPGHAAEMRRALDYARTPLDEAAAARAYLDFFGSWMVAAADRWLDTHNPARESALPVDTDVARD